MIASLSSAKVQLIGAFAAMALISGLVVTGSSAAFNAKASNTGNAFETGTLALGTDAASALFNVPNMVPGQSVTRCVTVTYNGSIADPAGVKLYSAGYNANSGTLDEHLLITIDEGTGATNASCAGFTAGPNVRSEVTLKSFGTNHTDYANGVGAWDPASTPSSRSYQIRVKLADNTPDEQEGKSVTNFGLTWEVQAGI